MDEVKPNNGFQKAIRFFKWFFSAKTVQTLDSPFLISFYKNVIQADNTIAHSEQIESIRRKYLKDSTLLRRMEYGAGSFQKQKDQNLSVKAIARSALSSSHKCKILSHICLHFQPKSVLELGSSLGISSFYLAAALPDAHIISIEGNSDIYQNAQHSKPDWAIGLHFINNNFKKAIKKLESHGKEFDLVYIDGGHRSNLLFSNLEWIKNIVSQRSILIVDDIYWSRDMTTAWQILCSSGNYNVCIDMWYFGILANMKNIKEPIIEKLLPFDLRWQPGFFRI